MRVYYLLNLFVLPVFFIDAVFAEQGERRLSLGYANTKLTSSSDAFFISGAGDKNMHGGNLKYYYGLTDSLGLVVSGTFTQNSTTRRSERGRKVNFTNNYFSLSAGPAWQINRVFSVYSLFGLSGLQSQYDIPDARKKRVARKRGQRFGRSRGSSQRDRHASDYGVTAGLGMQFNPTDRLTLDTSWESSWLRDNRVNTWVVGVGYRF